MNLIKHYYTPTLISLSIILLWIYGNFTTIYSGYGNFHIKYFLDIVIINVVLCTSFLIEQFIVYKLHSSFRKSFRTEFVVILVIGLLQYFSDGTFLFIAGITLIIFAIVGLPTISIIALIRFYNKNKTMAQIISKRMLAWLVDYGLLLLVTAILENVFCYFFPQIGAGFMIIALCAFLCKDGFGMPSLGKRIMGINVIYADSTIKPIRALCRNLFLVLLPIEAFLILLNRRRIGDIICKTDVITNKSPQSQLGYIWQNVLLIILLSIPLLIMYYSLSGNTLLHLMYTTSPT